MMSVAAFRLSVAPRLALAAPPLALALMLAACGGQDEGNGAQVEMSGLQKADGTINDAMTDLDGVQVDGIPAADTGNGGSANGNAAVALAAPPNGNQTAASGDDEVVADQ